MHLPGCQILIAPRPAGCVLLTSVLWGFNSYLLKVIPALVLWRHYSFPFSFLKCENTLISWGWWVLFILILQCSCSILPVSLCDVVSSLLHIHSHKIYTKRCMMWMKKNKQFEGKVHSSKWHFEWQLGVVCLFPSQNFTVPVIRLLRLFPFSMGRKERKFSSLNQN